MQNNAGRRGNSCDMDGEPRCNLSEEAAEHAIKKVFAILGVDVDKPESVEDFREDLRFGRKLRKIADHSVLAFFGVVAVALAASVWAGIVSRLGEK